MRRRHVVDLGLVALVSGTSILNLTGLDDLRGGLAANLVYPVVIAALVMLRRRYPVGAGLAFVGVSSLQVLFLVSPSEMAGAFLCLLIFPFTAGAHATGPRSVSVLVAAVTLFLTVELAGDGIAFDDVAFPLALCTASFFTGRNVHSRTRLAAELHEAAVQAEEAREHEAERAMAAERRRIARELHDVVAHSLSVMVVQAGGARRIMDRDRGRAVEAAREIERTGREALVEMRRLLGVLHPAEGGRARSPQPGLDGLEDLVERARTAGLPVTLHVEGERREIAAGLELTAYRIVQEGLTNAIKHAGSAATEVSLRWSAEALDIEIADRGRGRATHPSDGGHGIIGMRERARMYGGDVETGSRPGGGFAVRARLPLEPQEVTA